MRTRHRILVTFLVATGSVGLVLLLVALGARSEGPISATAQRVGRWVAEAENRVVHAVRGPGRMADLAWLEPLRSSADSLRNPRRLLLGAFDGATPTTLQGVVTLEDLLDVKFPLIHFYTAWGDDPDQRFPQLRVEAVHALGSIPVITWEPWLSTFENRLHPHLPLREDRDVNGLASVSNGDYDFYLDAWAREAAAWGHPLLVRLAHEFNDPYRYPWGPHNNQVQDFIAAWRHVVERFRAAGADNVLWVWSPHVAYQGYERYWPGNEYVDWVATGALNYGDVAYWSQWWSFDQIFGRHYEFLTGFGKPIMIAEFGTLSAGGDPAAWFASALEDFRERYPGVNALLFFHVESDATVTRQAVDWGFSDDPAVLEVVKERLSALKPRQP
jgi:hypothetical protein